MEKAILKTLNPTLMVSNVNDTVKYYKEVLGFSAILTVPEEGILNFAMMQSGGAMLMFQSRENIIEEYPSLSKQSIGGGLTLFIQVENVDYIYEQIKGNANIIKELHTSFYGMKEFAIEDCNGFILTFAQKQ